MSEESGAAEAVEESVVEEVIEQEESSSEQDDMSEDTESSESSDESSGDSDSESAEGDDSGVQAENEEELEQELQEAAEAGASEEELLDMVREYTIKVNGKEMIKKIDLSDDDALKKELQLAAAGRKAMQDSAELKNLYNTEIDRLRKDPMAVLQELDIDPLELSAAYIEQYLQDQAKTPEEREKEQRLSEFEQLKAENEKMKKEREDELRAAEMAALEQELEDDIMSALDSDDTLPNTPEVIAKIADTMIFAANAGFEDVKAADVLPTVKDELQKQFRSVAGSLKSTEAIKALLGEDVLGKLREERLEQVKNQVKTVNSLKESTTPAVEKKKEAPKKKVSLSDFMSGR